MPGQTIEPRIICVGHICGYSNPDSPGYHPCKGCIPDEQNRTCDKPFHKDIVMYEFTVLEKNYQM